MPFKEPCPSVTQNPAIKISDNLYQYSDIATVGKNIYRSRTPINYLLTKRNKNGSGKIVDY
jgi:hypothetical protein